MHYYNPATRGVRSLLFMAGAATAVGLSAQTAPAPAAAAPESEEEIVVLSPFEVTATADSGYVATDTLAGTRIRSELRDLGSAVQVITKDLMNDIGATDAGTLLQYTANAEVSGTKGTFSGLNGGTTENLINPGNSQRVRGLAAADNTRDYYMSDIPWDSYNVDRIDILRGPNSFLFGLGSPAGIQNASLQNAAFKTQGRVEYRIASYGSQRANINYNHVLIDNVLSVRVAGLWDHENFRQRPAFENDERIYGALRWDPKLIKAKGFNTSFKVKYEAGDIKANRPRTVTPMDSVSAWYRPVATTPNLQGDNPFGGMGKFITANVYDPYRTDSIVAGDGLGQMGTGTANYIPYLADFPNQQQPYYTIDGATNQQYDFNGGYINAGAINSAGALTGVSVGIPGKRQNGMFFGVKGLGSRALAGNAVLKNAQYGGFRDQSLLDPSIFDFYQTLIDGPNKSEFQRWTAYNIDFSQTAWDDRLGLNLTYDKQTNKTGGESLLGWQPTISIDVNGTMNDGTVNSNVGRPFVTGAGGAGGSWNYSERETLRASLFAELRVSDLTKNRFLVKLLGKHRFNGVASSEEFFTESRGYQLYANDQAWAGYWNGNAGNTSPINDRPPLAFIYLGNSIRDLSSASGANIPGITTQITLNDGGIKVFDPTPTNLTMNPGAPWTVPESLMAVYNGMPYSRDTTPTQLTQSANPANQVGWNTRWASNLMRADGGNNVDLLTRAQMSLMKTRSYAGSWQAFFWNNALVTTLGWRYDEVKTKDIVAGVQSTNRNILNVADTVVGGAKAYVLPEEFPEEQIIKGHSLSRQAVLHVNRILTKDFLPINVSLSFVKSSNFRVGSIRRDLYGTAIGNPNGETTEYGVLLATKDNKYSLRLLKYETAVNLGSAELGNSGGLGGIISNGLNWRNVFLYELGGYDYPSRDQPSYRNSWINAYPEFVQAPDGTRYADDTPEYTAGVATANLRRDEAIRGWNEIQTWLNEKGFFQAWNFNPTGPSTALVDRATYLTNPTLYAPSTSPLTVYSYGATAPPGFTVTADTLSKGYEAEFTANPLPNWRIAFNAARTEATRNNVGGTTLNEFIEYMDSKLLDASSATGFTAAGEVPRWGGAGNAIGPSVYNTWKSNYVKMKLLEGNQADEIRKWRFNVMTNYSFSTGFLKGSGVGAAYRWQDKNVIGYAVTDDGLSDLTAPYYGPEEDALDLWLSYERKLTAKINWKIQLNARNVLASDGVIPTAIQPDGKTWATVRVAPNREWMLTNTFSF